MLGFVEFLNSDCNCCIYDHRQLSAFDYYYLCISLLLDALYISTEDAFPTKRLHQLAMHLKKKLKNDELNLMDSIFIEHAADVVGLV